MSMTEPHSDFGVADRNGRMTDGAKRTARPADRRELARAVANEGLIEGELLALDEFIVRVLRRAHQAVEPLGSPGEHRAILHVAHLFADELERTDPRFDRARFIAAVAHWGNHA
jgi:hypothetical protein